MSTDERNLVLLSELGTMYRLLCRIQGGKEMECVFFEHVKSQGSQLIKNFESQDKQVSKITSWLAMMFAVLVLVFVSDGVSVCGVDRVDGED